MQHRPISLASQRMEAFANRLRHDRVGVESQARISGPRADRDFGALLQLLRPRIGRLIAQYRLLDMVEDAEQAAAIGVHRALETYDPAQASFATHATWQMRGELQGLRHRMRLDQRRSAKSAGVMTVSLESLASPEAGPNQPGAPYEIVDEAALQRTECAASDHMAGVMLDRMLDRLSAPLHERVIVQQYVRATKVAALWQHIPQSRPHPGTEPSDCAPHPAQRGKAGGNATRFPGVKPLRPKQPCQFKV